MKLRLRTMLVGDGHAFELPNNYYNFEKEHVRDDMFRVSWLEQIDSKDLRQSRTKL